MATTITTINPPATKTALGWNWQDQQSIDPLASQPTVTLAAGLKTGTRADGGTVSNPPTYTVAGVNGIAGPGGAQVNGVIKTRLAAGRSLTVVGNGTSGATAKTGVAATGAGTTGLTVNLVAVGGVVTGATVNNPGTTDATTGSLVTVTLATAGTTTDVTLRI
jgi:hypothetical protein